MGVRGQHHAPAAFTPWKDPVPIVQEAGWALESVWIGAENLTPTGIGSLALPAIPTLSQNVRSLNWTKLWDLMPLQLYISRACTVFNKDQVANMYEMTRNNFIWKWRDTQKCKTVNTIKRKCVEVLCRQSILWYLQCYIFTFTFLCIPE